MLKPEDSTKTLAQDRRSAILKLGRYAMYAAPLTLIAPNATATQSGSGSGGRSASRTPQTFTPSATVTPTASAPSSSAPSSARQ